MKGFVGRKEGDLIPKLDLVPVGVGGETVQPMPPAVRVIFRVRRPNQFAKITEGVLRLEIRIRVNLKDRRTNA